MKRREFIKHTLIGSTYDWAIEADALITQLIEKGDHLIFRTPIFKTQV